MSSTKASAELQKAIESASLDADEGWALPLLVSRLEEERSSEERRQRN